MLEPEPYDHVVDALSADPEVREARMMGMRSLNRGGRMFCGTWHGELVVKLGRERVDELVRDGRAERFDPSGRGRPMQDWAQVPEPADDWLALAGEALDLLRASSA